MSSADIFNNTWPFFDFNAYSALPDTNEFWPWLLEDDHQTSIQINQASFGHQLGPSKEEPIPTENADSSNQPASFEEAANPAPSDKPLTAFTKKSNWQQRIVQGSRDLMHVLSLDGCILHSSPSSLSITGHSPDTLSNTFLVHHLHPDDSGLFIKDFNESIATASRLRGFYRFKREDGEYVILECVGNLPRDSPESCSWYFLVARPYPLHTTTLLDSLLDQKMENERLTKKLERLKREALESDEEDMHSRRSSITSTGISTSSHQQVDSNARSDPIPSSAALESEQFAFAIPPHPNQRRTSNYPGSAQERRTTPNKPPSLRTSPSWQSVSDTSVRPSSSLDEWNQDQGSNASDLATTISIGDAGIPVPTSRDQVKKADSANKESQAKRVKSKEGYVCDKCGTDRSAEWRKGPNGPKTLCNACGLVWAKERKKLLAQEAKH